MCGILAIGAIQAAAIDDESSGMIHKIVFSFHGMIINSLIDNR